MSSRGVRDIPVSLMQVFTPTEDDEARTASGSSSSSLLAHFVAVRPTRCCCCGRRNLEGAGLFVLVLSCGGLRCSGLAGCPPLALTGLALPWWLPCPSHPPSSPSDDSSLPPSSSTILPPTTTLSQIHPFRQVSLFCLAHLRVHCRQQTTHK